ncbi:MAG: hypothetical protein M5U34_16630 [Chloroflexi bacterium]|nr:hypothetical protein [Chloroflexota bacterium]
MGKKNRRKRTMGLIGLVVVGALLIGVFFVVRTRQQQAQAAQSEQEIATVLRGRLVGAGDGQRHGAASP